MRFLLKSSVCVTLFVGSALTASAQSRRGDTLVIPISVPNAPKSALSQPVPARLAPPANYFAQEKDKIPVPPQKAPETKPAPAPEVIMADDEPEPKWGPTMPEDVGLLMRALGDIGDLMKENRWRTYGWINFGYTYASTGDELLTVMPRENRFGDEFLMNQIALVLEKTLDPNELSWGFNSTFYMGADPALIRPRGGFVVHDPRFGYDFRQLYTSLHLPILSDGGVDLKLGRMGTVIGYNSALAPYRPFYSSDYQWFYAQDGAFTGLTANWHATDRLDIFNGITLGANTFFTLRGNGPCWIHQMNYWLQEEKRTLLSYSIYMGNQAIFSATPPGDLTAAFEVRVQHDWNKYFTQIVQSDFGFENRIPGVGEGQWYSLYTILINHVLPKLDFNYRTEWFYDNNGTRTGFETHYFENTWGLDFHPVHALRIRPELRWDWALNPVFGGGDNRSQLTAAIDAVISF